MAIDNEIDIKARLYDLEQHLQSKGYNWDLATEICILVESIVDYYGKEYSSQIIEAVKSCEIEILPKSKNDVSAFKYKDGEYISTPIIENGQIIGVGKKIILPPNYNTENQAYRGMLLNQLLKLVRSYNNEYRMSGETLEQRQGFKTTKYKVDKDSLTKKSEIGTGYEVGSVDNITFMIMLEQFDEKYELPGGNDYERILAGFLEGPLELKEVANFTSISGNYQEFDNIIQTNSGLTLNDFLTRIDQLHNLENKRKSAKDDKSQKEALKELENYFSTQIAPIMHAMNISYETRKISEIKQK